jgi:hypothetical protein
MIHPRRLRPFMKPILVLQEILQGNSTAVLVSGYSHRWHVGTKENINRTTLLLQDAIGWAIRNVLPHISEILYPDSMSKSEKKKNFAENCLVCTLLNRIVNCLPGTIINPWCLFETSSMPPAAGKIIYEIRVIFIAEAMNGRYVTKQVMVGGKVIQKENCLSLLVVINSLCTGGSTIVMMNSNRLYAPGLAECRVITEDKYFTYPIAGEVYKVAGPGKPLMKIADTSQMSQETSKGEKHLEGYTVELRSKFSDI